MENQELETRVRVWMDTFPGVFQLDLEPDGIRLVETASGKSLHVRAGEISGLQSRQNPQTNREYLVLERHEHPPLAMADAGFVFSLDTRNTGPVHSAPPVMSFRDYRRLYEHLRHLVEGPEHRHESLDLMRILIASVDGARQVGLSTEVEEGELEVLLRRLEADA